MSTDIDLDGPAADVYATVVRLDDDTFDELMAAQDTRDKVIDALVDHLASRLRPEKAEGVDAVLHVKLWDRPAGGYDHRELVIRDGACTVSASPEEKPTLTLKIRPSDLRKVVNGSAGPKRLALRGKLRAIGDIGFGMRLTELFDLSS
jgi:putative sterol carrier protein